MTQTTGWRWPWESDPTPSSTPEELAAIQKAKDDLLLQRLNRPGWSIVDHAPYVDKSGKAIEGQFELQLAGPNGQPDNVIVDADGRIVSGGGPQKDPDKPAALTTKPKPSPPDQWVTIPDGNGNPLARMDPETGAVVDIKQVTPPSPSKEPIASAETVRHNQVTEGQANDLHALNATNQQAQITLAQQRLAMDAATKAFDESVKLHGQVTQDAKDAYAQAHQQAQDAQAQADLAERAVANENTRQFQQGQLSNQQANTAESTRANTARETQATADSAQAAQRDQQASLDRQQTTGAQLLNDRATHSTSLLNNWTSMAAGNKNFGLGGAIPQGMAAGLMSDANTQATQAMGGQSVMDQATQMVHRANPALAGTPQGAAYVATAAQMLEKQTQQQMQVPAAGADGSPPFQQSGIPEGSNRQSPLPLDPAGIGTAVGAAIQHIGGFTAPQFAQSGISEGTTR